MEESKAPGSGVNCQISGCEHGTHVAGIAAANDGGLNRGVAYNADIISIQVFSNAGFTPWSWISDQIKGLERVFAMAGRYNIAAVNMSLGSTIYLDQASCDAANGPRKAAIDNLVFAITPDA